VQRFDSSLSEVLEWARLMPTATDACDGPELLFATRPLRSMAFHRPLSLLSRKAVAQFELSRSKFLRRCRVGSWPRNLSMT